MSAVLAVVGPAASLPEDAAVHRMLDTMRARGLDVRGVFRDEGAVLAVGRYRWELDPDFSGETLVASDDGCAVVADASLYYRADLVRRLRSAGVVPRAETAGHLILAAYRAWGREALDELEGDYAFVLWDSRRKIVFAARDFVGTRPLYYANAGPILVIASEIRAALALPGISHDLNLPALAQTVSMVLLPLHETSYSSVRVLPAAHALVGSASQRKPEVTRFWDAPEFAGERRPALGFAEAADELNRLLVAATAERLGTSSPTAVTLSGGWDSPAVYAAAHEVLRRGDRTPAELVPVSISFPEGDSGREDELITTIAARYGQTPHWLDIGEIPLLGEDFENRAASADDPFIHVFSEFNRSMGQTAAEAGARVVLNGGGGDHLFHCDPSYLADLVRSGHIIRFLREWKAERLGGLEPFREWVIRPLLGPRLRRTIGRLHGRTAPRGYLDRSSPPWYDPKFIQEEGLDERVRRDLPQRAAGERAEAFERRWMLEHPMYQRAMSAVHAISLEQGADQRSPLLDGRIVQFAALRPRVERRSERQTKRLLRASVSGLVPPSVLLPRESRTGTTSSYFQRSMMTEFGSCAIRWLSDPLLAELGIVDRESLYRACASAEQGRVEEHSSALLIALHAEIWLRARHGSTHHSASPTGTIEQDRHGPAPQERMAATA